MQKKYISISWWRRFYIFGQILRIQLVLDKFKSRKKSLRSRVNERGSDDEQLASNVSLQWTLSPSCCPWSSSESELSSLHVRFFGGFGTSNSSLCGQASMPMADLDTSLCIWIWRWSLLYLLNKSNNQTNGILVFSKPCKCDGIWCEEFIHLEEASHTLHNKYEGNKFYLGHLLYPQNKEHNIL